MAFPTDKQPTILVTPKSKKRWPTKRHTQGYAGSNVLNISELAKMAAGYTHS